MAELPSHSESDLDVGSLLEIVRMVSSDISSRLEEVEKLCEKLKGDQQEILKLVTSDVECRFEVSEKERSALQFQLWEVGKQCEKLKCNQEDALRTLEQSLPQRNDLQAIRQQWDIVNGKYEDLLSRVESMDGSKSMAIELQELQLGRSQIEAAVETLKQDFDGKFSSAVATIEDFRARLTKQAAASADAEARQLQLTESKFQELSGQMCTALSAAADTQAIRSELMDKAQEFQSKVAAVLTAHAEAQAAQQTQLFRVEAKVAELTSREDKRGGVSGDEVLRLEDLCRQLHAAQTMALDTALTRLDSEINNQSHSVVEAWRRLSEDAAARAELEASHQAFVRIVQALERKVDIALCMAEAPAPSLDRGRRQFLEDGQSEQSSSLAPSSGEVLIALHELRKEVDALNEVSSTAQLTQDRAE